MFSSTIIPTINRSTLSSAVRSILDQEFIAAEFEVIVVNDSGQPLPDMEWQHSERVHVINTSRRERSVARNTGAAIANGRYLHFLDDDDVLLPGALNAFWQLDQQRDDSIWLHGSYRTVDNNGSIVEEIFPENQGNNFAMLVAGEGIPLQSSLLDAKQFHAVGLFDPTITGVEDRDLGRRIAMIGKISYTHVPIAQIRIGREGSTTNWAIIAEGDRQSREKAFNLQNSLLRALSSARSCKWHGKILQAYWRGRVCRAYVASMLWNLQRKNLLTALNRGISALIVAGFKPFSMDFWRGVRDVDLIKQKYLHEGLVTAYPPANEEKQTSVVVEGGP